LNPGLIEYISDRELTGRIKQPSNAEHYLLFEFDDATTFNQMDLTTVYRKHRSGSDYMAVTCDWSDILNALAEERAEIPVT
jgi:hypothetical protein